jgi:hypothetical protein
MGHFLYFSCLLLFSIPKFLASSKMTIWPSSWANLNFFRTAKWPYEHRYNLKEGLLEKSKLARHAHQEGHRIICVEARILEIESNRRHRKYKESAHMAWLKTWLASPVQISLPSGALLSSMRWSNQRDHHDFIHSPSFYMFKLSGSVSTPLKYIFQNMAFRSPLVQEPTKYAYHHFFCNPILFTICCSTFRKLYKNLCNGM